MPDLNKIIDELSKLTVVEAADLSKKLEEKWGVSAAAPVAAAPAAGAAAPAEEKSEFTIFLSSPGDKKINVIKEVRALTGLGLKEAKDLVEGAPKEVKNTENSDFSSSGAAPPDVGAAAATGAAAVTPHFSSNCFERSAASTTVNFDNSSIILFKSVIEILPYL